MKKSLPWILAVVSGIIGFLGYVGFNQFYLQWVFMVPLFWVVRDETPGRSFLLGWLTGTVGHAGGFYWFFHMLEQFAGLNFFLSIIGLLTYAAYNGLTFAIFIWAVNRLGRKKGWSVWWTAPVIWTAIENIYPFLFPNYLGASQYMLLPLIQIADITGILGVSFLLVFCNATVYSIFENWMTARKLPVIRMLVFAGIIGITCAYGIVRIGQVDEMTAASPKIKVLMVQVGEGGVSKHKDPWEFYNLHYNVTQAALQDPSVADTDIVIWPESVLSQPLSRKLEQLPDTLFAKMPKPVLFGAYTAERKDAKIKQYVSGLLVDENLNINGVYDKQVLVPFGEYIPLGDMLPVLYKILPYTTRFWPGKNIIPFEFMGYRFSVNICYEDIFPDLIRQNMITGIFFGQGQPHAIINLTNDSWYGDTVEPLQHLVNASFRAIEHRRPLVRSTNTGISAFIDPVGRLDQRSGQWTKELIAGQVPMMTGRTIYSYTGNWLGGLTLLMSIIMIGLSLITKKQKA